MSQRFRIGLAGATMLMLLRICIGWHFLYEGMWKYNHAHEFSAEPYLKQARGPLAETYKSLIPDYYGRERLDVKTMTERWRAFLERAANHYQFDEGQRVAADGLFRLREAQLNALLKTDPGRPELQPEIKAYLEGLAAWQEAGRKRSTREVPHEQERHFKRLQQLQQEIAPVLAEVDAMDSAYKASILRLATKEQQAKFGAVEDEKPLLRKLETATTYTLLVVGVCLLTGLLTRVNALVGAVFMLTAVVLPQLAFPDVYPPPPASAGHNLFVTKEVIEMVGLLVLAATPAGRYGGLDFLLHALCCKYCRRKAHVSEA